MMCRRSSPHKLADLQLTKLYVSITRIWVSELERETVHFDRVADPIGNPSEVVLFGSESLVVPDHITHRSDLKTRHDRVFQWLGRSPIGNSLQRPGILSRYRIRWGHERLKKKVTCLFLIMAKSNVDRKPLGEMPVFRRGPGEGTQSSPIIVPSPDGEMRMAMAPDYPQGPEVARSASPPFIPYTAADRAVEDRFCALHGIQRPISPQYQPARFEEDIPVDPGFDRPLNPTRGFAENDGGRNAVQNERYPGAPIEAGLLVEEPSRFVALATTSEPGYQGVHYHTGRLDRVEPNAEGGFIQANQFRPMSFVDNPIDNQFRFQVDSFSDPGFPRNGKNPQFKDTDRTDPVFHRPERRQEFVNNHQSGFFTGGIPEANEPNLNAGDAGPPLPETSNGGSTDTSWSTFIAGVHRDIAASLDGFRAEHEVFLKQAQALLDNISQAQSGSSNGAPDPNSAPNESTFRSSRRPAAPPSPGAYPIEEWLYLERDQVRNLLSRDIGHLPRYSHTSERVVDSYMDTAGEMINHWHLYPPNLYKSLKGGLICSSPSMSGSDLLTKLLLSLFM
ncbi:hypothetical protein PSTT_03305 [Puccinia striiformis]|uniref:Uncharacterized protein n=1 Tax=Puccinia striiformis TaxID=27350 RepID=A0A2S4VWZ0_9BASI|nr:hypothetical protein PSTT_03305 [Puccinia striiformis]